jgi:alanine dehydrogenase
MYGCGHQADAHLPALAQACDLEEGKVYSPTRENREEFAAKMDERLDLSVRAVEDPKDVAAGADIVNCATNSTEPVFDPSWIEPGTHIGSIRPAEFPIDIFDREEFEKVTITKSEQRSVDITGNTISGHREEHENVADPWRFFVADADPLSPKLQSLPAERQPVDDVAVARLPNVVSGATEGRTSDEEITVLRQVGHGIAFAAIGHVLYNIAEEEGLGTEVASELLTQDRVP